MSAAPVGLGRDDYCRDSDRSTVAANRRLEMAAMLDASDESSSTRSVQLFKLLDEEIESSRDHKMRKAMADGKEHVQRTMKYGSLL